MNSYNVRNTKAIGLTLIAMHIIVKSRKHYAAFTFFFTKYTIKSSQDESIQ